MDNMSLTTNNNYVVGFSLNVLLKLWQKKLQKAWHFWMVHSIKITLLNNTIYNFGTELN